MTSETGKDKPGTGGADQRPHATLDLKAKEVFPEGAPPESGAKAALPPGDEPKPKVEPEPSVIPGVEPEATEPERAGSGIGGFLGNIAAAVIGGILALAAAYLYGPLQGGVSEDMIKNLAEAQQRIAALENASRKASSDDDSVEMRLRTMMEQANALKQETTAVAGRVQSLEQRPAAAAGPSPEALQQALQPLNAKIGQIESRLDAVAKSQEELRASTASAALTMAVQNLRRAVADGKPFATELKTLTSLTAEPLDLAPLEARQGSGLASLTKLQRDFDASAKAALDAAKPAGDGTFTGDLLAKARGLVRVRPTGDVPGNAPEAILARAEHRLDKGDLPAAISETGQLAGPAAEAMTPWLTEAKAKAAADAALTRIETKLTTSLGTAGSARQGG